LGYEGTVTIVEPAGSWFDFELYVSLSPSLFPLPHLSKDSSLVSHHDDSISLYLILSVFFGSIGYLIYKSYFLAGSPPTSKSGSKRSQQNRSPRPNVVAKDSEIRDSAEAVKEGEKVLDQDWIPDHHLRMRTGGKGKGKQVAK